MPDPLQVLPNELWNMCIQFAIDGQHVGPLEFIMVSARWEMLLLDSPPLWSQIYIQGGEDEMARISTFLHLSKRSHLHVDIMTAASTPEGLELIEKHISRVTTILVRPGALDITTASHTAQWTLAASYMVAWLTNNPPPSDAEDTLCVGINLEENDQLHYHVILMQFRLATAASTNKKGPIPSADPAETWSYFLMWGEHVASTIRACAGLRPKDQNSIRSITKLADYAMLRPAVADSIPLLIRPPEDDDVATQFAIIAAVDKLVDYPDLRQAVGAAFPEFIKLLEGGDWRVRSDALKTIIKLTGYVAFRETIGTAIPWLIGLLKEIHLNWTIGPATVKAIDRIVDYDEHRQAVGAEFAVLIPLLRYSEYDIRIDSFGIIMKLADEAELRKATGTAIPSLIELLEVDHSQLRSAAVEAISKLANHAELCKMIGEDIPWLVRMLEYGEDGIKMSAGSLLENLAQHVQLHKALKLAVPSLIGLLGHKEDGVRQSAVSVLGNLAKHVALREAVMLAIPSLIELAEHTKADLKSSAVTLLDHLTWTW